MNDILGDLNTAMDGMTSEEKANIISKIFNKTDLSSVNALLANTGDTWDELQGSIASSAGAAQQMADTQLNNLQGQLTILPDIYNAKRDGLPPLFCVLTSKILHCNHYPAGSAGICLIHSIETPLNTHS